jgi:hypothetical protein
MALAHWLSSCHRNDDRKKRVWWSYKRNWPHRNPPTRLSSCRLNTLPRVQVTFQVEGAPLYLLVFIGPRLHHLIVIAIHPSLPLEALRDPGARL